MSTAAESAPVGSAARTLRVGVIGVGRIGRMHAELLARRVPGAAGAALFDAHAPSAGRVGAGLGGPGGGPVGGLLGPPAGGAGGVCTGTGPPAGPLGAAGAGG